MNAIGSVGNSCGMVGSAWGQTNNSSGQCYNRKLWLLTLIATRGLREKEDKLIQPRVNIDWIRHIDFLA